MPISVGPAGKIGDGVNGYHVYKVTSDMFSIEPIEVDRRYSDFLWLHTQLSKQCAGFIIPPLPAKVVGLLQGPEFLEQRRVGLERFLRKVVEHDELRNTNCFKSFLECSPVELTALKTQAQQNEKASASSTASLANVTQRTQALNSWWGKAYQRITENEKVKQLAAKAGRDISNAYTIEDAEFEQLHKYVTELNQLVKALNNRMQNAYRQNRLSAGAACEMIEAMNAMADAEETFSKTQMSEYAAVLTILDTRARQMDGELEKLAIGVDDFSRWMGAVVNAMNVREDRRLFYQSKLAAKGKSNTSTDLDGELLEAKEDFERVHARVMSEVKRFRAEKTHTIQQLFLDYAKLQMRFTNELTSVLEANTPVLESVLAGKEQNNQMQDFEEAALKMEVREDATSARLSRLYPTKGVEQSPTENEDPYADVCL